MGMIRIVFKYGEKRWVLIMGLKLKVKIISRNPDRTIKCQILGATNLTYTNVSQNDILPIEGNENE